jgi:predicted ATPase/DNA-binding SARP family transcriptional activator
MGLLRLNVLGAPEVFHDGSRLTFALRKAQALLLYLAVEGGMHHRRQLDAFLWPDSEPHEARAALRNAIVLLRRLLSDPEASPSSHTHLLSLHDLLSLDPHTPVELDLDVVLHAWKEARKLSMVPSQEQHAALVTLVQCALALMRGPFLDGFWLGEDAPFDAWREQQQRQWQVRLLLLLDRLSFWQEAAGEFESANATLARWVALDRLSEEACRRLMRISLVRGDAAAALQVYASLQAHLAEALRIKPSPETVALAEHSRTLAARDRSAPARPTTAESRPPSELVAPLLGRSAAFRHLVGSFQQTRQGQPQAVLVVGEAGIGKTRLADEFVAWSRAQGAEALRGHAFEMGGRLPYQPLVEALRERLETENAPEDLLEDVWLAELSRLLPELRVRYPDLPAPTEDELTAKARLFEAVARLLDALAKRAPLVLLVDDLQWADEASLDLLRYLGHSWKEHSNRVLLLGTVRGEELELNPQLSAQLVNLGRDLPVTQVSLQPLSQVETLQLIEALVGEGEPGTVGPSTTGSGASPSHAGETKLSVLADFLFAQTGGQPLYLLETLKLLREQELLVPRRGADGTWWLEQTVDMAAAVAQERSRRELLPPSVRALIQTRLAKLTQPSRQLVMASAVLGIHATAQHLWQVAELGSLSGGQGTHAGVEALEEAVRSGILREEQARAGLSGSYRFAHDLIRDVVYTDLGEARRQVLHQRAFHLLLAEGARASELAYHAFLAGEAEAAYRFSVQAGMEAVAVFAVADAIGHYEQARALLQVPKRIQTELSASEVERLYVHLGRAYADQNAWQKAQEAYEELLTYAHQQRQFTLASLTLNRLAILAVQQASDKPKARTLLEEALHMAEISQDQRALAETEWNLAQITTAAWEDPMSAFSHGQQALSLARALHDEELEARSLSSLGWIHLRAGDFEEVIPCFEASLALYARLHTEQTASQELSLAHFLSGAPLTQSLTNRAAEAFCWAFLSLAQAHVGQMLGSIRSGRRALALSQETRNVWAHFIGTFALMHALLDTGAYEEAFELMQDIVAPGRTLPPTLLFQRFLTAQERTYHALQQWEEARSILIEADAVAEKLDLGRLQALSLSQLCMNYGVTGEWEAAYHCAVQAIAIRNRAERALNMLDFSRQYETEALLRAGDERQAREEVRRLEERLESNRRFRIPSLRSLAILAVWEGEKERAIGHLREAAQLAAEIGLPAEQWQIQAALGSVYETAGEQAQAHTAFGEAARIIQELAQGITDETLRSRFLAGPQIHPVLQYAQRLATSIPDDHTEPSGL